MHTWTCCELAAGLGRRDDRAMDDTGFGFDDLSAVRRAVFELAVEQADGLVDRAVDWPGWVDALWGELGELFGWQPRSWDEFVPNETSDASGWASDNGQGSSRTGYGPSATPISRDGGFGTNGS